MYFINFENLNILSIGFRFFSLMVYYNFIHLQYEIDTLAPKTSVWLHNIESQTRICNAQSFIGCA